jgi:uncharacterized SAM-binding protein YcdF (DUF218 family)
MRPKPGKPRNGDADAIIALGCALRGGAPSPALTRRVACAVALLRQGRATRLMLAGGGDDGATEAEAMRDIALHEGVADAAILLELHSRNTYENAFETARLLHGRGFRRIILVTDRYHLPRARMLFRAAGHEIVASAHPPSRGILREWPLYLREAAAFALSLWRLLRRRQ